MSEPTEINADTLTSGGNGRGSIGSEQTKDDPVERAISNMPDPLSADLALLHEEHEPGVGSESRSHERGDSSKRNDTSQEGTHSAGNQQKQH